MGPVNVKLNIKKIERSYRIDTPCKNKDTMFYFSKNKKNKNLRAFPHSKLKRVEVYGKEEDRFRERKFRFNRLDPLRKSTLRKLA